MLRVRPVPTLVLGLTVALIVTIPCKVAPAEQSRSSPPWDLTVDQRIAVRGAIQERARATAPLGQSVHVRIDGALTPEALLPWELFNRLLATAFNDDPQVRNGFRSSYDSVAVALGLGHDLWPTLTQIVEPVQRERNKQRQLAADPQMKASRTELTTALQQRGDRDCRLRRRALSQALSAFGREPFLRFLYQGVAPSLTVITDNDDPLLLRRVEEGCP